MIAMLANHLWQSTLFVAVMGVLVLALRSNGAHLRYWLWMAASLKFVLPFSLLVALGVQLGNQFEWRVAPRERVALRIPAQWTDFASAVVQPAAALADETPVTPVKNALAAAWSLESIALLAWASGFIAVMGFWLYRWLQLKKVVLQATPLELTGQHAGLSFPVTIKCAPGQIEPGIVGVLHPLLLVPEGLLERLTRKQVQAILAHERCHLERRDNLTAAVHMLVEAVFWFHPVIWWVGARLIEERERACDAAVLKAGNDPETYAAGILDVCQHYVAAPLDCVAGVSGSELKKRVRSIMTHQGETRLHGLKSTLLAAVATIVVASPIFVGAFTASRADAHGSIRFDADTYNGKENWPAIASSSIAVGEEPANGMGKSLLTSPNGTFTTRNWSLRGVIAYAYGIQDSEILEPSAHLTDIASTRYNIFAQSPAISTTDLQGQKQFKLMVRRLLAEKFNLQFHWETRRAPVYVMTVSAPNLGLKVANADDPGPGQSRGANSVSGHGTPLILLKQFLSNQLRRPILDLTELTGIYNYKLKWGPEPGDPGVPDTHEGVVAVNNPTADALIEAMQNQLGLALASQDADVQRMIVDRLELPPDLQPKPIAVRVAPEVLDRYVGYYDFPQSLIMTFTRDGEKLFARLTGQPPLEIFASGDRDFFAKAVDVRASVIVDDQGRATEFVLQQSGREARARRLDDTVAKARIESLKVRIRDKIAQPGTETSLRAHLEGMLKDAPPYDLMSKDVEAAVRAQWSTAKSRYAQLGQLRSIEFKTVDPTGADMYLAVFENGSSEWRVGHGADGKIDRLNYRRVSQP